MKRATKVIIERKERDRIMTKTNSEEKPMPPGQTKTVIREQVFSVKVVLIKLLIV